MPIDPRSRREERRYAVGTVLLGAAILVLLYAVVALYGMALEAVR